MPTGVWIQTSLKTFTTSQWVQPLQVQTSPIQFWQRKTRSYKQLKRRMWSRPAHGINYGRFIIISILLLLVYTSRPEKKLNWIYFALKDVRKKGNFCWVYYILKNKAWFWEHWSHSSLPLRKRFDFLRS